jgi:flagellin-like hook-associated protein FlgL
LATDSSYGGQNLLNGESIDVVFNEAGDHILTVDGADVEATTAGAIGAATLTDATDLGDADITTAFTEIDAAINLLRTEAQKLSSSLSSIQIRADFTNEMVNTLNTGGDNLVLADMNEEGANMLMLQTRQNLGTTSLSLASQAAQSVLRLF